MRGSSGRSLGEGTRIRPAAVPSGSLCTSQAPSHSELMVSPDHVGTPPHSPPPPPPPASAWGPLNRLLHLIAQRSVCTGGRRGGEPGRGEGGGEEGGEDRQRGEPLVALLEEGVTEGLATKGQDGLETSANRTCTGRGSRQGLRPR